MRNDYDNRVTALRAIIGRYPKELKKLGAGLGAGRCPSPMSPDYWVDRALKENLNVRIAESNFEIAKLEVDRARGGHYPTVDLVGSYTAQGANAAVSTSVGSDSRTGVIGVQVNVPIYQGGFVDSRVREAVALLEKSRQDLEASRRVALFAAQTGLRRRRQRHRVGEGVRAGRRVGGERALLEHRRPGSRRYGPSSTCSRCSRTSIRRAAISPMPTSSTWSGCCVSRLRSAR